jgi:HlyD family secretion protein
MKKPDKTAIDFLSDPDEIEHRPLPRSARLTLHALAAVLLAALVWASLSRIDVVIAAQGRLVTPLPNIVVQPLEMSIIQSIDVRVGQVVKKGEKLATLDPTFTEADETQLRARVGSLDNQIQRMEAELAGTKLAGTDADSQLQARLAIERQANYAAQAKKLDESVSRLRASLDTNRRDQQGLASRVQVLREMEASQKKLVSQKYAVKGRLLEAQDRTLEAERALDVARSKQVELTRELAALEAEKQSFASGWRQKTMEELLAVTRERDALGEQLQKADRRSKMVSLTSPTDAVVLDIAKLSQGSVVQPAEKLVTLVPLGAELEAEVQINATDVGYLKTGDRTLVKLEAFPFQQHGMLEGTLRTVSEDAFRRDASSGAASYYLGRVNLGSSQLKGLPENTRLLPGMTLTAEIVVGKRSVISYFLWPLTKAVNESIREP